MFFAKKMNIRSGFNLYVLIGFFNTLLGYAVIYALSRLNFLAEISNLIGYVFGFLSSYFFNKRYTFKSSRKHKDDFPLFLLSMSVAYLLNLITLIIFYRIGHFNLFYSNAIAGVVYLMSGYLLSKFFLTFYNANRKSL